MVDKALSISVVRSMQIKANAIEMSDAGRVARNDGTVHRTVQTRRDT